MYYTPTMQSAVFEAEKNRKAFLYTVIICVTILLLAFFITWPILNVAPPPISQDLIEINLGNDNDGFGETQPLIKGEMNSAPQDPEQQQQQAAASTIAPQNDAQPDDNAENDAAAITKTKVSPKANTSITPPVKQPVKTTTQSSVPTPKPPKPVATYKGPGNGKGNGATEDNGYRYQGNTPGGKGDNGSPTGDPNSYGNTPGGLKVSKGDRKIVNNYIFVGDLPKATINAIIKVSPEGRGTFVRIEKGSTDTDPRYKNAIISYLPNIVFNKSDHESTVTVPFNFKEN